MGFTLTTYNYGQKLGLRFPVAPRIWPLFTVFRKSTAGRISSFIDEIMVSLAAEKLDRNC